MPKAKTKPSWKVKEKPREIRIPKPRVGRRQQQAAKVGCAYHVPGDETQAEEFCGAWVNDGSNDGLGRECHKPLCSEHADVRLQLWPCPEHTPSPKSSASAS